MNLSFETLFILGIAGFYLYDLAMLLYFSEIIVTLSFGKWSYIAPADRWIVRGKILYIPNPLTPSALLFRFDSYTADSGATDPTLKLRELGHTTDFIRSLRTLRYLVAFLFGLMCVLLPLIIIFRGTGIALLWTFAAIYLNIFVTLTLIYRKRVALHLSRKTFVSLAFDALACPPFAINLLRKITLRYNVPAPLLAFAAKHFESAEYDGLNHAVNVKLKERLEAGEANSAKRNINNRDNLERKR